MSRPFEVRWEGELAATPDAVWDAITKRAAGWLWKIEYEPRVGGAERGLTGKGTVTAWDEPRHFATRAPDGDGFNQLNIVLVPRGSGTHVSYTHQGVLGEESYDLELDACRRHTAFYCHSLGEYVRHFAGRDAAYLSVDAPEVSAAGGFAAMRRTLGLADDVAVGDRVRLSPAGIAPIDGVVDFVTDTFLGVRTADALYRFYGRDTWGWPVGVAHHLFAADADEAASEQGWKAWLDGIFAAEAVA